MKSQSVLKNLLAFVLLFLAALPIMAQSREIKGTVFEKDGTTTVVGVTVLLKGSTVGTLTDANGEFKINVTGDNPVLVFQNIGYIKKEVPVGNQSVINVTINEDVVELNAVVVTALGISREEKSLGYAVSKVNNEAITKSISGNWLTKMSGKVAGLNFGTANSGPISSQRVTLRGDNSLNYGNNEVLFVIDGVPVLSGSTTNASGTNYASGDAPVDFGDAASDLNPDDIETVSVLHGASATALYGSRAANGAIIITTKAGRKDKGFGVTVNSSTAFENAGYWPDFQTEYGSGSDLGLDEYCFWPLTADEAPDGIATTRNISRYAFGEKFDKSQLRYQYASKNWETGEYTKLPWVYQKDWYTGLFQTGVTFNNSITIDGGNGKGSNARLSYTDTRNSWILPNTGYNKQNVSLSVNNDINQFITVSSKVNYLHLNSDNMPVSGYDETSPLYALAWGYNSNSINDWKNEYFNGRYNYTNWSNTEGTNGQSLVYPSTSSYNPYRSLYEELNGTKKNRVYGNIDVTLNLLKGLTLDLRSGLDWDDEFRTQQKPYYTTDSPMGLYRQQDIRQYEFNNDFMLRYLNNNLVDNQLGLTVAFGGNMMERDYFNSKITLPELGIEGVYNPTNLPLGVNPDPYNYQSKKEVNSLYGLATLSWKDTYYLDMTARNDWSSTLSRGYWSFFYPSVSASVLLNNVLNFRDYARWIDLLKLRLSWANVGNDTNPYSLAQCYSSTSFPGGYTLPGTIVNPKIKPENVESYEAGLDGKLFMNRLSFELTFYRTSTTNQIVTVDLDQITGATGMKINAGEIQNKGVEISTHFVPVETRDFNWSIDMTWSANKNRLVSLQDGWNVETPLPTDIGTTIGGRVYIYSYVGQEMHQIYGRGYQRAPKGSYYTDESGKNIDCSGMKLVDGSGYPILDDNPTRKIGNVNPIWRAGMTHTFSYKDFSLSASFTGQWGGHCYSVTNFSLSYQGKLKNSLPGRYDGLVVDGVNQVSNGDGTFTYTKNNNITSSIETYYNSYVWNRNNVEENTFSTSYLKLTELRFDYRLPKNFLQKTKICQNASLGIFATNVFCITKFPQYDPETGMLNGSEIFKGIEAMAFPMTRSYGLNIKLSF
ncbi:MAG: SusC/RagA family TonB-linked outer membrane protein [Bacteroidota bacterium]|nr:SusC/RagA family TonB-linked outer membrane protein [Bacteroidota bacterium]